MYYYRRGETVLASLLPDLPLEPAERPAAGSPGIFLIDRDPPPAAPPSVCQTPGSSPPGPRMSPGWTPPGWAPLSRLFPDGSSGASTPGCCGPSTSATPGGRSSSTPPAGSRWGSAG